jgi:hypothetical protein
MEAMKKEAHVAQLQAEGSAFGTGGVSRIAGGDDFVMKEAQNALASLSTVYKEGHGDISVRMMDSEGNIEDVGEKPRTSSGASPSGASALTDMRRGSLQNTVISEDDEEEEEREEQEEEQEQAKKVDEEEALKSEWDAIEGARAEAEASREVVGVGVGEQKIYRGDERSEPISSGALFSSLSAAVSRAASSALPKIVPVDLDSEKSTGSVFGRMKAAVRRPSLVLEDADRDMFFHLANVKYDPAIDEHFQAIQTVYRTLTKTSAPLPQTGPHWELVGFQGLDPKTDLNRSMGMLTFYLTLKVLEETRSLSLGYEARSFPDAVYACSRVPKQDWPFMCVCVGFTLGCLSSLRNGALYSRANKAYAGAEQKGWIGMALADLLKAQLLEFYAKISEQPAVHHAEHLAAIRKKVGEGKKGVKELLGRWDGFVERGGAGGAGGGGKGGELFSDMETAKGEARGGEVGKGGGVAGRASNYHSAA